MKGRLTRFLNYLQRRNQKDTSFKQPAYNQILLIEGLVSAGKIKISWEDPHVDMEYDFYQALYGMRADNEKDRQRFLNVMALCRTYINLQRAAFNGAASKGYTVGRNGETHISPVQPNDPLKYRVCYPGTWEDYIITGWVSKDAFLSFVDE